MARESEDGLEVFRAVERQHLKGVDEFANSELTIVGLGLARPSSGASPRELDDFRLVSNP